MQGQRAQQAPMVLRVQPVLPEGPAPQALQATPDRPEQRAQLEPQVPHRVWWGQPELLELQAQREYPVMMV